MMFVWWTIYPYVNNLNFMTNHLSASFFWFYTAIVKDFLA